MELDPAKFHVFFTGNPGTGKTTLAKIYAKFLYEEGVTKNSKYIAAKDTDFFGEYVGQSQHITLRTCYNAEGGTLHIQEAYKLNDGTSYGDSVQAILMEHLTEGTFTLVADLYADKLYMLTKDPHGNPGWERRIPNIINIPDYTKDILRDIAIRDLEKEKNLVVGKDLYEHIEKIMEDKLAERNPNFGNAGFAINISEKIFDNLSHRMELSEIEIEQGKSKDEITPEEERTITYNDIAPLLAVDNIRAKINRGKPDIEDIDFEEIGPKYRNNMG